jgi:hypothetical protein
MRKLMDAYLSLSKTDAAAFCEEVARKIGRDQVQGREIEAAIEQVIDDQPDQAKEARAADRLGSALAPIFQ